MNHSLRNVFLILILTLSVLFLPALSMIDDGPAADEGEEDDDLTIIHQAVALWNQTGIEQATVLITVGLSIFTLFVVYLGGRSKHRRFNDRTIDPADVLTFKFLKTALDRAVFNFPCPVAPSPRSNRLIGLFPFLFPSKGVNGYDEFNR